MAKFNKYFFRKAIRHGNADESPKNFRSYIVKDKCTPEGELAEIDAGYRIDTEIIMLKKIKSIMAITKKPV